MEPTSISFNVLNALRGSESLVVAVQSGTLRELAGLEFELHRAGKLVRTLDGRQMRSVHELLLEFATGFQFPWYYGENSAALDDCLTDLSWLVDDETGIVIVIKHAEALLLDEPEARAWFIRRMLYAFDAWSSADNPVSRSFGLVLYSEHTAPGWAELMQAENLILLR
jgi:RNAse (barnase) inhibitor barstar